MGETENEQHSGSSIATQIASIYVFNASIQPFHQEPKERSMMHNKTPELFLLSYKITRSIFSFNIVQLRKIHVGKNPWD